MIALLITLFVCDPFDSVAVTCALSVIGGVILFTFFTQMFWDESTVQELFGFFIHSFKLPGIIFTLDIGGVLFLIFGKIFLAILGAIASVLFFLIGLIIAPIASVFIFPFALLVRCVKGKKLKNAADAVKNK